MPDASAPNNTALNNTALNATALDATALACPRCDSCVEVTKYSREHTITRWVDGHASCPELGVEPARFATGRCETLTAAVRAAFDDGLIDARERVPGT